jgi:hypothetical protein
MERKREQEQEQEQTRARIRARASVHVRVSACVCRASLCRSVLQCNVAWFSAVQCIAVCNRMLHLGIFEAAVCCSALQCTREHPLPWLVCPL